MTKQVENIYHKATIPTIETGKGQIFRKVQRLWVMRRTEQEKRAVREFKGTGKKLKSKNGKLKVSYNGIKQNLFEIASKDVPEI